MSILLVILLHGRIRMHFAGAGLKGSMPRWLIGLLFGNGDNGVTVFFAVSGFLITLTSIRRFGGLGRLRAAAFYRIRLARIAPPLLLVLAVLCALHLAGWQSAVISAKQGGLGRALLAALTFTLNWWEGLRGYLPANWDVLWSLSVEEAFYLGFPLACLALLRWRRAKLGLAAFVALLFLFVAMGPFARTVWTAGRPVWQEKSYLGGMDAIALGCLTALLTSHLQQRVHPLRRGILLAVQGLGAALIALIFYWPGTPWMAAIGRLGLDGTILAAGTCCVMLPSALRNRPGSRLTAPLRWFGRLSYEVYLTHEFAVILLALLYERLKAAGHATGPTVVWIAAMVVAAVPLGWAMARLWSEPMNRRLRRA